MPTPDDDTRLARIAAVDTHAAGGGPWGRYGHSRQAHAGPWTAGSGVRPYCTSYQPLTRGNAETPTP